MRSLPPRPPLSASVQRRLREKTNAITELDDLAEQKTRARTTYESARGTQWFRPVVDALRGLCGAGELCMYCSSNEPSQVEHYRPLSAFPALAFAYENYLWTCDICNRTHKGERFPPDTGPGERILNPLDDNVWDYFFLSEQNGRLIPRYDTAIDASMPRALSTCAVVGIDRENVQIKRMHRFRGLRKSVEQALTQFHSGTLTQAELREGIKEWLAEAFQADVADYFLNGPGGVHEPFQSALAAAKDRPI